MASHRPSSRTMDKSKGNSNQACLCSSTQALIVAVVCSLYTGIFVWVQSSSFYTSNTAMLIHVTSHLGQTTDVVVMSDDTVLTLKEKIAEEEGTPVQQQRLIFLHQTLDDSRTLREYRIRKNSVIHLAQSITRHSGIRVLVSKVGDTTFTLVRVYGNETPLVLKQKVSDIVGIPVGVTDAVFNGRHLCDYSRLSELNLDPKLVYRLSVVPVYGRRYPEIGELRYELHLAVL